MKIKTILVGTDFSPLSHGALHAAGDVARLFEAQRLHLVHVAGPADMYGNPAQEVVYVPGAAQELERRATEQARTILAELDVPGAAGQVTREVRIGNAAGELKREAEAIEADLLVVATHGRGALRRLVMGSVTSNLIRSVSCPVLVVGEERADLNRVETVLAAVDLSRAAPRVLSYAVSFAAAAEAKLELLSVQESLIPPTKEGLRALVDTVPRPKELELEINVLRGNVADKILEHAADIDADLIVIGTSGHNFVERAILGSAATHVTARAKRPVLVIPHQT